MQEQVSYVRAALKEPLNIGGLVLAGLTAVAAAITGPIEPVLILGATAIVEGFYLTVVPRSIAYRRRIDRRAHRLGDGQRRLERLEIIT